MIEIKNLTKKFHKDFDAICNLSHEFSDVPWVVIGSDMSGKTTLLNIIAGLDLDYTGEVIINGVERRELNNEIANISYITAIPTLFENKSVYNNLLYVFKVGNKKLDKEFANAEIKKVSEEFGLFGVLEKKVKKCNLFEKRLICLARAVLKKSKLILFDEPFSNLLNFEFVSLWQTTLAVMSKLSCGLIVAENTQNMAYFKGVNILKLDFGVKVE